MGKKEVEKASNFRKPKERKWSLEEDGQGNLYSAAG